VSDTEEKINAPAQEPSVPPSSAQEPEDDYDKPRALETIRKQRVELKDAKAKLARLEQLEAAEQQKREADLSESEKLRKQLADLQRQHDDAQAELRRGRLLTAATRAAEAAQLAFHPGALEDALRLGAFDDLDFDDAGKPKEMPEAVKRLAKERPYLLKSAAATGADLDARARGATSKQDEDARRLEKNASRWGIRLAK